MHNIRPFEFAQMENFSPIAEECFWTVVLACPKKGAILELGSGRTTEMFAQHRKIYSIENDKDWMHRFNEKRFYIHAPLEGGFYSRSSLQKLPQYDVLFIDGPAVDSRMEGFLRCIDCFDRGAHWVFDDIGHVPFMAGVGGVQRKRKKTMIRVDKCYKKFGVIFGD